MKINEHYLELEDSYLFSTVARKQREYQQAHPEKKVIRLSIGDVPLPLAPVVIKALEDAVKEMLDNAMARSQGGLLKFNKKKRVDRDGYTVLYEKDFAK